MTEHSDLGPLDTHTTVSRTPRQEAATQNPGVRDNPERTAPCLSPALIWRLPPM